MVATPDQIPTDLAIEIGENLPPDKFMAAARAFFGYVQEITASLSEKGDSGRWLVKVREGSALLAVDPGPNLESGVANAIYFQAERGMRSLLESNIEDAGLSEPALKHLRTLSEMTETRPKVMPIHIRLWVKKSPINFDPVIASTIRESRRADYNDYGTIEGRLETIQESFGTLQFNIRDPMFREKVRCYFPEDLLPQVFDRFRKRVEVAGIIHYRKNGTPVSIEAEHIIGLPEDSELPTADDVRGILSS